MAAPLVDQGMENADLRRQEDYILSQLNPTMRREVQRIVLAGMQVAIKGGPTGILRNLRNVPDPVKACAVGAVNLAFMMIKSQTTHPTDTVLAATAHASYILMLEALDVAAKMKLVEITPDVIERATKDATNQIFTNMHITPQKFNTAATAAHGVMKSPEQMQQINLKIGADRDPRAPTPTLPETTEAPSEPA